MIDIDRLDTISRIGALGRKSLVSLDTWLTLAHEHTVLLIASTMLTAQFLETHVTGKALALGFVENMIRDYDWQVPEIEAVDESWSYKSALQAFYARANRHAEAWQHKTGDDAAIARERYARILPTLGKAHQEACML